MNTNTTTNTNTNDEFTVIETRSPTEWADWQKRSENVHLTEHGVELGLDSTPTYVAPTALERGSLDVPVDVDADPCGTRYVLGADGALYRADADESSLVRFACDGLRLETDDVRPVALCVTGDTIYVVAGPRSDVDPADTERAETDTGDETPGTAYVQGLSVQLRQTRWIRRSVGAVAFSRPIRAARGPDDACYVLDRGHGESGGFVARLSADGTTSLVATGLRDPRDLTVDTEGRVTVLDVGLTDDEDETVESSTDGGETVGPLLRSYPVAGRPECRERVVEAEGRTRAGRSRWQRLPVPDATCLEAIGRDEFVVGVHPKTDGEQTLYRYTSGEDKPERLTSFKRSCRRLHRGYAAVSGPPLYVIEDAPVPDVFVLEPAERISRWRGEFTGQLTTWFDLGTIGARYYRVSISLGEQPSGTRVALRYATTDNDIRPDGPLGEDEDEPTTPDDCTVVDDDDDDRLPVRWTPVDESTPTDVLVEANGRRFLWLRLDLVGTPYESPVVEALKVSLTHESYLEYLPTIYVEDKSSAEFLGRFLSVFEDTFGDVDHAIETLTRYFGAESVPTTHLSWLGGWLATAEDDAWAERSKRTLVSEAPRLFKQRGTKLGLSTLLDIYLDGVRPVPLPWEADVSETVTGENGPSEGDDGPTRESEPRHGPTGLVSLVEYGDVVSRPTPAASDGGANDRAAPAVAVTDRIEACDGVEVDDALPALFSDLLCCPQEFLVVLAPTVGAEARETVERIVAAERPAHTVGRTVSLSPWSRLSERTYLGVNSYLPPPEFVVDVSRLEWSTVVGVDEPQSQLGFNRESRLDEGFELS